MSDRWMGVRPGQVYINRRSGRYCRVEALGWYSHGVPFVAWRVQDGAKSSNRAWPGYFLDCYARIDFNDYRPRHLRCE